MNERPSVNRLREAMRKAEYGELEAIAVAIGREAVEDALGEAPVPATAPELAVALAEQERREREDDAATLSMEILARWRQRVNRSKWTRSDGVAQHKIIEALRALPGDE